MKKIFCLIVTVIVMLSFSNIASAKTKPNKINTLEYMNLGFWSKFNDENLNNYMDIIYRNNTDIKTTSYKVNEAQRLVKISLANELPQIGFDGYIGRTFKSSDEVFGNLVIPNYAETQYLLPLTMNYEIDIWGENRLKTKAQEKQLDIVRQDERAAYISLTSAFASDYYNLIKIDKLIELQKELISTQKEVIKSVESRYKTGTATINELILSKKSLTYLQEELNNLDEKQDVLQNQMEVYISDRTFPAIKRSGYEQVEFKPYIPESISSDLLDNRPDRIKSELRLQKVGYDVRIAKRELLPKFDITGTLGFNAYNIKSAHTFLADLGISPHWDIFTGGRKIQLLKLQKDEYNIATEAYKKSILTALQETNDALYLLKSNNKKYLISQDRFNLDNQEMILLKNKKDIGTADKMDLLLKREELLNSQKEEVSYKINEIIAEINLYKAVGGIDFTSVKL